MHWQVKYLPTNFLGIIVNSGELISNRFFALQWVGNTCWRLRMKAEQRLSCRQCLKSSILLQGRSLFLTTGGYNSVAAKCVLTSWPPLRLPELLSVESSPVLPGMHYLVFFFELRKSAQFSPLSTLRVITSNSVPFMPATMSEARTISVPFK